MVTTQSLEGLITSRQNVHNGQPIIAGTAVAVRTIVRYYKLGLTAEEISGEMGVELAGVYAALAYYHLNQEALEADMAANTEAAVKQAFGYE